MLLMTIAGARWSAERNGAAPLGVYVERRRQESRPERLERTKREIAERLERLCRDMPPEDFEDLVTHMAQVQIKYTLRRSADLFPEIVEWERGSVELSELGRRVDEASPLG
jgi:hypothetical protein